MDRREFLSIAAISPIVFGFRELLGQDPPAASKTIPDWYTAALKRMKDTNRYGIVIIVPDDEKERARLGNAITDRYNNSYDRAPLGVVVLVCLTKSMALTALKEDLKDPKRGFIPNRFLLDPEGRKVDWDQFEIATVEDPKRFNSSFSTFAYGRTEERLKAQAKALEKSIPKEIRKTAEELAAWFDYNDQDKFKAMREMADAILPWADAILPLLVFKCREAEDKVAPEVREGPGQVGLRVVLDGYWDSKGRLDADPCLPFGVKVEWTERKRDTCPMCGLMSNSDEKIRRFLSFYEK